MATHSNILAWRIPWTEKLGELQSMGSKESDITEQLTHTLRDNKGALKHCIQKVPTRVRMNRRYTLETYYKELVYVVMGTG